MLLWIVCTPLLAYLLGPSMLFRVLAFGDWLALAGLSVKYFYLFLFKKDDNIDRDAY